MDRSKEPCGRSSGLNAAGSALAWDEEKDDAVEPCDACPTARAGTSAAFATAGGGLARLGSSAAGGG